MATINDKKATQAEIHFLSEAFQTIPHSGNPFSDKKLNAREILDLFDSNKDGKVQFSEIAAVRAQMLPRVFWKTENILEKHGFNIFQHCNAIKAQEVLAATTPNEFLSNRECALMLIKNDASNFKRINPDLKFDLSFVFDGLAENPHLATYLDKGLITYFDTRGTYFYTHGGNQRENPSPFLDYLIIFAPAALQYLDPPLNNDKDFMKHAVELNPKAYAYAASTLKEDDSFSLLILVKHPALIEFAPKKYTQDSRLFFAALEKDINLIDYFDPKLLEDPAIALTALARDIRIFWFIPQKMWSEDLFLAFFEQKPSLQLLSNIHNPKSSLYALRNNLEFAKQYLQYIETEGLDLSLSYFSPAIRENIQFNELLLYVNHRADLLDPQYVKILSAREIFEVSKSNKDILAQVKDPQQRKEVFALLLPQMRLEGVPFGNEFTQDAESFFRELASLTRFPNRFEGYQTIYTLWKNKKEILSSSDPRPIALLVYPSKDWNVAFERSKLPDQLVRNGKVRALYFEVDTDSEAIATIQRVSENGKKPIQDLVLAGHGTRKVLAFGGEDLRRSQTGALLLEEKYLDTEDMQKPEWQQLSHYLQPNATLLLYSCSNGEGGEKAFNLANTLAQILPSSMKIFSSPIPSNIEYFKTNPATQNIMRVKFWNVDEPYSPSGKIPRL